MSDKSIQVTYKLYRCRETVRKFLGDKYQEKIEYFKDIIILRQQKYGTDILPSVMAICSDPDIASDGMMLNLFFAAAVELIEEGENVNTNITVKP